MVTAQYLPPEGGWGYAVAFGYSIVCVFVAAPLHAFGLIFGDFLKDIGDEATSTTIINTVFFMILYLMGLVLKPLLTKFSLRAVGVAGSIFFTVGSFICIFVTSVAQLIWAFSVLRGIGSGLMILVGMASLNNYFKQKLALVTAVSQTGNCIVHIGVPFLYKFLMDTFGYRKTLFILAVGNSTTIIAMMLMRPVEWYLVPNPDTGLLNAVEQSKHEELTDKPMIDDNPSINKNMDPIDVKQKEKGILRKLTESLDLSLIKDMVYMNMVIGTALTYCIDVIQQSLSPLQLLNKGFTLHETTICLTIAVVSNLISRIFLILISIYTKPRARYIVLIATFIAVFCRTLFAYNDDFITAAVIFFGFGFTRGWIQVESPLVFSEYVSQQRFPAAIGLFMAISGLLNCFVGGVIGLVSNISKSDISILNALSGFSLLCVIPWMIEILFCKRRSKDPTGL